MKGFMKIKNNKELTANSCQLSYEVLCGLEIVKQLGYCVDTQIEDLYKDCTELSAMISGLKKKLKADDRRPVCLDYRQAGDRQADDSNISTNSCRTGKEETTW